MKLKELLTKVKLIHLGTDKFNKELLGELSKNTKKMISCTMGSAGSKLFTPDKIYESQASKVDRVVDTIGAGDSYLARFVFGLTQGESVESLLQESNNYAARTITYHGATEGSLI